MQNRQKKILAWVLTWAGLLVLVLYSPVGSPDLYTGPTYYIPSQGVNFNTSKIANSNSKLPGDYGDYSSESIFPDYSNESKTDYSYNTSASEGAIQSNANYSPIVVDDNSSYSTDRSGGTTAGVNNGMIISGNRSGKSAVTNQNYGSLSINSDLSSLTTNNGRQTANTQTTAGGGHTDPGGDPKKPPIPVGDGWIFLLVLSACYAFYKFKFAKNDVLT